MAFTSSDIVLVTGGNGHVAQHVIQQLLAIPNGPSVRASVRSSNSAAQLSRIFSNPKLEVLQIPDIIIAGTFDDALVGVSHIAHVASPLVIGAQDTEKELLVPTIQGTTSILTSALACKTLKRVVVTGSFAAVFDASHTWRPGYTYSPEDWNPITYAEAADPQRVRRA
jgi:nucleoside-diphosphate-sugar epimerase